MTYGTATGAKADSAAAAEERAARRCSRKLARRLDVQEYPAARVPGRLGRSVLGNANSRNKSPEEGRIVAVWVVCVRPSGKAAFSNAASVER